jgi:RNA polymerase sigma factor (sigma-70 family)
VLADHGAFNGTAAPVKYPTGFFGVFTGSYDPQAAYCKLTAVYTNRASAPAVPRGGHAAAGGHVRQQGGLHFFVARPRAGPVVQGATSRPATLARLPGVRQQPFEVIVAEHGPTVWRVCRAVLGPAVAEDAWSETFLSAMQAYPGLRPGSSVEAWLVTIAHRKAVDQLRAEARRAVPTGDLPEAPSTEGVPGNEESDLLAAVKALPPKQRQTIAYHYLAGLPDTQVAEIVGGSAEAARRAAADGIAALRKTYQTGPIRKESPDDDRTPGPGR